MANQSRERGGRSGLWILVFGGRFGLDVRKFGAILWEVVLLASSHWLDASTRSMVMPQVPCPLIKLAHPCMPSVERRYTCVPSPSNMAIYLYTYEN
jgi:hypothetical protein